jgi:hypothetical protein
MQLEIDAIKKAAAWPGTDRRTPDEGGAAVPLMGPADHGSASPLMGPATAGTITPGAGPGRPGHRDPAAGSRRSRHDGLAHGPRRPRHGHAVDAPKPVMPRSDRRPDVSPDPAAIRPAGPGERARPGHRHGIR